MTWTNNKEMSLVYNKNKMYFTCLVFFLFKRANAYYTFDATAKKGFAQCQNISYKNIFFRKVMFSCMKACVLKLCVLLYRVTVLRDSLFGVCV